MNNTSSQHNKALFLDRDGIVNYDLHYLYKIEDFKFVTGIFKLCSYFQQLDYKIFIITNQSGIARGYYSLQDLEKLNIWLLNQFKQKKIHVSKIYFCPHIPQDNCQCRKPKIGMIEQAQKEFDIDVENSVLVGDNISDVKCAYNVGIKQRYLVNNQSTKHLEHFSFEQFNTLEDLNNFFAI